MSRWAGICADIAAASGHDFVPTEERAIGGGSINEAWLLADANRRYFVKLNRPALLDMFVAEAEGLQAMHSTNTIRVPEPLCYGSADGYSYLVMEYIASGGGNADSHAQLGEQLAAMHRHTADRFGWHRDNTIGSTPQPNDWHADWLTFLREQRLGFQVELALRKGASRQLRQQAVRLLAELEYFFESYVPEASLLHGDLWSGNYSISETGEPLIFDPAVYYGDREADLAMTELFGGFPSAFYAAYRQAWPLDPGYKQRKTLYNLYHILNHYNLFGGGYEGQAINMFENLNNFLP
jgi:fructosamine-3-kinase